jgi:hypothetical protein
LNSDSTHSRLTNFQQKTEPVPCKRFLILVMFIAMLSNHWLKPRSIQYLETSIAAAPRSNEKCRTC